MHNNQRKQLGRNRAFSCVKHTSNPNLVRTCVRVLHVFLSGLSAATSLATLDDFVPVMLEAEDENYNLFKLINELNKEVRLTPPLRSPFSCDSPTRRLSSRPDRSGRGLWVRDQGEVYRGI